MCGTAKEVHATDTEYEVAKKLKLLYMVSINIKWHSAMKNSMEAFQRN